MRKKTLWSVAGLMMLPVLTWAQVETCNNCLIGIFDDVQLNKNYGDLVAGTQKHIYVGVNLDPAIVPGYTGLEFSVYGMRQMEDGILVLSVDALSAEVPLILGTLPAPADTTAAGGVGGVNVAWSSCQPGGAALDVQILTFGTLTNKVFKVLRKFPPANDLTPYSLTFGCDAGFTPTIMPGGCYIVNWDGTTDPVELCEAHVAVSRSTWTGMKQLYR